MSKETLQKSEALQTCRGEGQVQQQNRWRWSPLVCSWTLILAGVVPLESALAQASFSARQGEKRKEGWYFSDHLTAKSESARQDVIYRFYQSQAKKNRPRLEPFVYGLGSTGIAHGSLQTSQSPHFRTAQQASSSADAVAPPKRSFASSGFGGEIFFNHFVSGFLGVPTLNIVPGVRGERVEDGSNPDNKVSVHWGPSVRLFGAHGQDTALFLSYRNTRRSVLGEKFEAWHWQGGGRFYFFPALAAEGEGLFNEDFLKGKASSLAGLSGWRAGGYLEFSVVRMGYRFSREVYRMKGTDPRKVREERRSVYLGIAY